MVSVFSANTIKTFGIKEHNMWILVYINLSVQSGITTLPINSYNTKEECAIGLQSNQHNIVASNEQLTCIQLLIAEEA